jgi:hypothetical protein
MDVEGSPVFLGLPVLHDVSQLHSFLSACLVDPVTHVTRSKDALSMCKTAPNPSGLANPVLDCKSAATISPCAVDSHVLLFSESTCIVDNVSGASARCLPNDRLTVICLQNAGSQVAKGDSALQWHADFVLGATECVNLGLLTDCQAPPHFVSTSGLPLYMLSVHTGILAVKEKPIAATCFDSFVQLNSCMSVAGPDLSSTCVEFEGTLMGRAVRVLLDSGASANFVSPTFVNEHP